jgi:hypothetical protein
VVGSQIQSTYCPLVYNNWTLTEILAYNLYDYPFLQDMTVGIILIVDYCSVVLEPYKLYLQENYFGIMWGI